MIEPVSTRRDRWHSILGFMFSRRQLIRVAGVLFVGAIVLGMCFTAWYRPPRATSRLIQSVGGNVQYSDEPNVLVRRFSWQQFRQFGLVPPDDEINRVGLTRSSVSDDWLNHLNGLERLVTLDLHDGQLGPGLAVLKDLPGLGSICVYDFCDGERLKHLQTLPHLMQISISPSSKCPDVDLSQLASLPHLGFLSLDRMTVTARQLEQVSHITSLHGLNLQSATIESYEESGLEHLIALPKLDTIYIRDVSDKGITILAKLGSLQSLCFCGTHLTDEGLSPLFKLRGLKDLRLSQCTGTYKIETVRGKMPWCRVSPN